MKFCDIQNNQGRGRGYQSKSRPWLFWISQTTESKKLFYYTLNEKKKKKSCFPFFTDATASNTKRANLTWLSVTLTWLLRYNLQKLRHRHWFRKFTVRFWPIRKEIASSMYNKWSNCERKGPNKSNNYHENTKLRRDSSMLSNVIQVSFVLRLCSQYYFVFKVQYSLLRVSLYAEITQWTLIWDYGLEILLHHESYLLFIPAKVESIRFLWIRNEFVHVR